MAGQKKKEEVGYVYILTNPSFREDWVKIGKSSRPVNVRSKELDNTAVPLPFEIYATIKTRKYHEVEKLVHRFIDKLTELRIRDKREFFNVKPEVALEIFEDIALTIEDAEVETYKDNLPIPKPQSPNLTPSDEPRQHRKERMSFSMCGIQVGDKLRFEPTGVEVEVADDRHILYEGQRYTLSGFTRQYIPNPNTSGSYQGGLYFSYQGKLLTDWREELAQP